MEDVKQENLAETLKTSENTEENAPESVPSKSNGKEESSKVDSKKSEDAKEYIEKLQRLQAEFANFQKRTEKEKQEILTNANADLILKLVDVLDNFELSLKHNEDEGVRLIYDNLKSILEKQGLSVIDTSGKFNPEVHEALIQEEGEGSGKILEELQKGYMLNDKLLKASKVKITKVTEKNE